MAGVDAGLADRDTPRVAGPGPAAGLRARGLRAAAVASPAIRDAATTAHRIGEQSARRAAGWLHRAGAGLQQAGAGLRQASSGLRQVGAGAFDRFTRVRTAEELPSRVIGALAIFLAALIAVLYGIFSGPAHSAPRPAVTRTHAHPARTTPAARPTASRAPSSPAAGAAVPLQPVRAAAFGPGGVSDGDNPQLAARAISARPGGGWNTNWYTTAAFGGLQSGTGLLLDLGRTATVAAVTIRLGPAGGAQVQLRAGSVAVPAGLRTVAQGGGGGDLTLSPLRPVQARYLLIWFTRLPPDSSGTYQATIYHVGVTGRTAAG
jgi:hypothetical protein